MLSLESLCQRLAAPLPEVRQLPSLDIAYPTQKKPAHARVFAGVSVHALDDVPGGLLVSDQLEGCLAR